MLQEEIKVTHLCACKNNFFEKKKQKRGLFQNLFLIDVESPKE